MFIKSFFGFTLRSLMLFIYFSVSVSHWIFNLTFPLQKSITNDFNKESNKINFPQQLLRNNLNITIESNMSFRIMSAMNSTWKPGLQLQVEKEMEEKQVEGANNISKILEDTINENTVVNLKPSKPTNIGEIKNEKNHKTMFLASDLVDSTIEKIILQRNNCSLEISVQETQSLKIEIEFQKLENNTSGKCCITLNGEKNTLLGVVISNIHLYRNASEGEIVKVIIADYGSAFILKEYYSWSKYQPLLLTETHKVYIVMHYEVTNVPLNEQNSHFNVEVFSYYKY